MLDALAGPMMDGLDTFTHQTLTIRTSQIL
jgi:hypothetical protein